MALKSMPWLVVVTVLAAACSRQVPDAPAEDELEPLQVTQWTDKTEVFAEYPPLVVGQTSRFAIHLTQLASFRALTEGHVEVQLNGGGPSEIFAVGAPSRPGIFGVDVKPANAGTRDLVIVSRVAGLHDEHRVGQVVVHRDEAAARAVLPSEGNEDEGISFLKEQQWALDFATAVIGDQSLRETMRVPAQIAARPGGAADLVAPIDGRLVRVSNAPLGAAVTQGQELVRLQPPPSSPGELPGLRQAQTEAASALQLATRDRQRAERLVTAGAAPQKRLDEAQATEVQAQARATGAAARLSQYDAARTAGASPALDGLFLLRAPVGGVIAERSAANGANVAAGTVLFRVVDARQVHVVGQVPEADVARVRNVRAAELEIPGQSSRVAVGPFSSIGRVLDPRTRAVPIIFALDNAPLGLALGQAVFLHLLMEPTASHAVVPASAVVDDAGRPIVFVQRAGETFERRAVTLGPRAGDVIQVLEGVKAGDRVVTKGAYLVRLASLSTQVPGHGHVH